MFSGTDSSDAPPEIWSELTDCELRSLSASELHALNNNTYILNNNNNTFFILSTFS